MRDTMPSSPKKYECGVVNLDVKSNNGTHWVAYWIEPKQLIYFDSFGLPPPTEIDTYLGDGMQQEHNYKLQELSEVICGHLCVLVLHELNRGISFKDIILDLVY